MEHTLPKQTGVFRDLWGLILLAGLAVLLAILVVWIIISPNRLIPGDWLGQNSIASDISQTEFSAITGARVIRVAVVAGGGMVDIRYQVVDPDKAVVMHDDKNPLTLVDEATGREINTPFHGHNDTTARTAITYSDLLVNSGGLIKPGRIVSIVVANTRLEHVIVQ